MKSTDKGLFLLIIFFICSFSLSAQTEHLKFMGIPITGSTIDFHKELDEKGFSCKGVMSESDSTKILEYEGIFTGRKVFVYVVSGYDIVWKIEVKYPNYNSFSEIEKDYKAIVAQYSIKYGNEFEHYEIFTDQENINDDDSKLQQLKQGQCFYLSGWFFKKGFIGIRINDDVSLRVTYEDAESQKRKDQYSKIQDDI